MEDYVDDIAKRAVPFGGMAEGTARMVAWRSSLAEYPANAVADLVTEVSRDIDKWLWFVQAHLPAER